jgi:VanZ family protein
MKLRTETDLRLLSWLVQSKHAPTLPPSSSMRGKWILRSILSAVESLACGSASTHHPCPTWEDLGSQPNVSRLNYFPLSLIVFWIALSILI